jgi:hypothetical protein
MDFSFLNFYKIKVSIKSLDGAGRNVVAAHEYIVRFNFVRNFDDKIDIRLFFTRKKAFLYPNFICNIFIFGLASYSGIF